MTIGGRNLPSTKTMLIDNNNILLEIYRQSSDALSWLKVHECGPIADTINPVYPPLKISG
jgi:hypothetical protein